MSESSKNKMINHHCEDPHCRVNLHSLKLTHNNENSHESEIITQWLKEISLQLQLKSSFNISCSELTWGSGQQMWKHIDLWVPQWQEAKQVPSPGQASHHAYTRCMPKSKTETMLNKDGIVGRELIKVSKKKKTTQNLQTLMQVCWRSRN